MITNIFMFYGLIISLCYCFYETKADEGFVNYDESSTVLRWAASGGGHRAMTANMGFINAFRSAGLIDIEKKTCNFTGVSVTSGASWFALQLFYSQPFLDKVLPQNPNQIYDFVLMWLNSIESILEALKTGGSNGAKAYDDSVNLCSSLSNSTFINNFEKILTIEECKAFEFSDVSWVRLIRGWIKAASTTAYNDTTLVDRKISNNNRLRIFQNTSLYIQAALAPVSKTTTTSTAASFTRSDTLSFIGPSNARDSVFSVVIPVQYAVEKEMTKFGYGIEDSLLPLRVYTAKAQRRFKFDDWKNYYLYNNRNKGNILTSLPDEASKNYLPLSDPFGGQDPTFAQIAAASSSAAGEYSGAVPSVLAQRFSVSLDSNKTEIKQRLSLASLEKSVNVLYKSDFSASLSVCNQWPSTCGKTDGQLLDGGLSDGPSMALNIGQYHAQVADYATKTMKIVFTNSNSVTDTNSKFLSYFSTFFNQGVKPGDYVWAPSITKGGKAQATPWRSMQIFKEYLDDQMIMAAEFPVSNEKNDNYNLTTAIIKATTIDNPAFGVKAGQRVEILLLRINSNVPTYLATSSQIKKWRMPMAETAQGIATNAELISRIKSFVTS